MHTLYTLGYTGIKLDVFDVAVRNWNLFVIDTRFRPQSRNAAWNRKRLEELLGSGHYRHVQELGNVNYKTGGDIQINQPETGIPLVIEQLKVQSVLLLCVCPDVTLCHRKVVADMVQAQYDCKVVHLTPDLLAKLAAPLEPLPEDGQVQYGFLNFRAVGVHDKRTPPKQKKMF